MKNMLLALALIAAAVAAVYFYPAGGPYYPSVGYADPDGSRFTFLHQPVSAERGCRDITERLASPLRKQCAACLQPARCPGAVPPEWRDALEDRPVTGYTVRAGKQRILVAGAQAAKVCALLEQQIRSQGLASARCVAPGAN
ncbi:MAG: hypothetical protein WBO23_05190 [Burkholderiales bacterium]